MENGLKDIFSLFSGERHFVVPQYQRAYSWDSKQINDFLEDINNQRLDKKYFLGTILFQDKGREDGFEQIDIVDGQQRITTMVIFMKVLIQLLEKKDKGKEYSREKRRYLKDKDYYKLELIDIDDEFFKTYIVDNNKLDIDMVKTPSQRRLSIAKKYFSDELKKLGVDKLKEYLKKVEQTKILTYTVEDAAEATLIFETTNDRGKPLTNLEKTKSFLMHKIYLTKDKPNSLLKSIHDRFGEIYRLLEEMENKIDEDSILQYHFIAYLDWSYSQKSKDYQNYVQKVKDKINNMIKSPESKSKVPDFINEYTIGLKESFAIVKKIVSDKNPYLRDLFILDRISIFFPLVIKTYKSDIIAQKTDFYEVIRLLEIFSFRVYGIGRKPSYTARDKLFTLARDFKGDFEKLKVELKEIIIKHVDEKQLTENLNSPFLYKDLNTRERNYLFWKYENYLREYEQPRASSMSEEAFTTKDPRLKLTIEHIASQTPKVTTEETMLPEITEEFKEKYLHSIGNITFDPNSANASKGNQDVKIKNSKYFVKAPFKTQNELADFIEKGKWTAKSIENRAGKIVNFAKDYWNPSYVISEEISEKYRSEDESEEDVFSKKENHKELIETLKDNLEDEFEKWFSSRKNKLSHKFKIYQSRDGYITSAYIRWKVDDTQLVLETGLWKEEESNEFKLFIQLRSRRKSVHVSYKMRLLENLEFFEINGYDDNSGIEDKPDFIKEMEIQKIDEDTINFRILQEMEKLKPILGNILD